MNNKQSKKPDNLPYQADPNGQFRAVAFLDLLSEAIFQFQRADQVPGGFAQNMYARSSILASALSIECTANCLLSATEVSSQLKGDFDKLPPLSKIESSLMLRGVSGFDRGRAEVQGAVELIKVRNDYVHPKAFAKSAGVGAPRDGGTHWIMDCSIPHELWPALGMAKMPMQWQSQDALIAIRAVSAFHRYLIRDLLSLTEEEVGKLFFSRMEVGNVMIPAVWDECRELLAAAGKEGADFSFLALDHQFPPPLSKS